MTRSSGQAVAVVLGSHLNAYCIYQSLRAVGWGERIAFIGMAGEDRGYSGLARDAETWCVSMREPSDLVAELESRLAPGARAFLFMTDERFHEALLRHSDRPLLKDAVFHLGPKSSLDVVLDRYAFYRFLAEGRFCETPRTVDGGVDPWAAFGGPFVFRFKRSWDGLACMDRVRIVRDAAEFDVLIRANRERGLTADRWCYQEILSTDPIDNVSVCGWHDSEEQVYRVTRTRARHPPQKGTALVCELVDGHEDLQEKTRNVLRALDFSGPFEMEFVRDPATGTFKAIELNPRFWLQHLLMQQDTNYALMRRYLGRPFQQHGAMAKPKRYWVNTVHALARLPLGDVLAARHLLGSRTLRAPELPVAMRFVVGGVVRRIAGRAGGR